jgi:hypothetical protein
MTVATSLATHLPTNLATHLPTNLATHLPTNLATRLPTNLATHLPTNLATHLPANVATHLPANVATHLPTNLATHLHAMCWLCCSCCCRCRPAAPGGGEEDAKRVRGRVHRVTRHEEEVRRGHRRHRYLLAVLRIHDILVWIRICESMTNGFGAGFGSGSRSCYFCHLPSRRKQKTNLKKVFLLITYFLKANLQHFSKIKSQKEVTKQ